MSTCETVSSHIHSYVHIYRYSAVHCISKLARFKPASASTHSLDHGLRLHLQTRSNLTTKFISTLARLQPPSSHDHGLQVHLHTRLITASKCISMLARSWPPSESPYSLDHDLTVYLEVHSIIIFSRTSNCSQAPPAASLDIPCVDG
jgi:hypothetical protein